MLEEGSLRPIEVRSWEVDCVCVGGWGGGDFSICRTRGLFFPLSSPNSSHFPLAHLDSLRVRGYLGHGVI